MVAFAPGSVVIARDEEWLVTAAERAGGGGDWRLDVVGLSELVRETTATFFTALDHDITLLDPREARLRPDPSPRHRRTRLWLEATLRRTPMPFGEPSLTVSDGMLVNKLQYQRRAVAHALAPENLRPRVLIADAVGLGKTLEIGMLLAELTRRGRADRVLVVTPRHVLEQMQHELWCRFGLPLVRLDSDGLQRVRQKLPANRNPFTFYRRIIVSIDTLKSPRYRSFLEKHRWDVVVIDESHNLTNVGTLNNELARVLAPNAEALILASATPHNGKKESFAELLRLLDPTAVGPDGEYDVADVTRLFVRRHRNSPEVAREVGADWAPRPEPVIIPVPPSAAEDALATELSETWLYPRGGAKAPISGKGSALFPWTLAKAFLSSPAALLETTESRLKRISALTDRDTERERQALERLRDLAQDALTPTNTGTNGKLAALAKYLADAGVGPGSSTRAVLFAERVATLGWLADELPARLGLAPGQIAVMHGALPDVEQERIVDNFKTAASPVRILVTGDVASEGVNLHAQCHHLVHVDIPWSLIRIEQRNGRIDRYGQQHPPQIAALALTPSDEHFSGDIRVLQRLLEKEHLAHTTLGDAATLMHLHSEKAEENAIRAALARRLDLDEIVPDPTTALTAPSTSHDATNRSATDASDGDGDLMSMFDDEDDDEPAAGGDPAFDSEFVIAAAKAALPPPPTQRRRESLYPSDVAFLEEALAEVYEQPARAPNEDRGAPPGSGGVGWTVHQGRALVSLAPPRDLRVRLDALPASYVAERGVREQLLLATAPEVALDSLRAAREGLAPSVRRPARTTAVPKSGKGGAAVARKGDGAVSVREVLPAHGSTWPEAHFLSPLHPVLDWAADKVLAAMGRGEVPLVRGPVDTPRVLVLATLMNQRGQVVTRQMVSVEFPTGRADLPVADVVDGLELFTGTGLMGPNPVNPGPAVVTDELTALVPAAIDAAAAVLSLAEETQHADLARRLQAWSSRQLRWRDEARQLELALTGAARAKVRRLAKRVSLEEEIALSLKASQRLLRPLVVVIPAGAGQGPAEPGPVGLGLEGQG
ncbi:helicase-related protein [Pseudofrankia sp. BMG5.37]|uniref:helicase-related protein n=1 Tax=Pseudofrankia sp. BMG5.37 TaxID=3050035 RepID=UPI002895D65C|nr:helicase-related protein [Pseudofrankia sp. BMG5.37]MDT3443582.1 helicase-related protein [Pseudofrankia sp. BMG5.37]